MHLAIEPTRNKSVGTTNSHYWVATMTDLHDKINNPTSDKFQAKVAEDDTKDDEIALLRQKKDLLLEVLSSIEKVLQLHVHDTVQNALSDIDALHPDLAEVLEMVKQPERH